MYNLLRQLLFLLPPETAHHVTLKSLACAYQLNLIKPPEVHVPPRKIMGLTFKNPLGLAAGLDKNGDYIEPLAALGFGFIEIGTVTPLPQEGNPKPRMFRLPKHEALINRLGFNNKGLDYVVERLKNTNYKGILGVNVGKNKDTSNENAVDDYVKGFKSVAPFASYVTINISSPNTPQLRELQHGELLRTLLKTLKREQALQAKYVPLAVKIAPDLSSAELEQVADIILSEKMDAIIATNTTMDRTGIENSKYAEEAGGLSGKPLFQRSTLLLKDLRNIVKNKIPLIGCGGILSFQDSIEKLADADLIQVYTGLIYKGPRLIQNTLRALAL